MDKERKEMLDNTELNKFAIPKTPEMTIPFAAVYEMLNPLHNIHLSIEMLRSATFDKDKQVYLEVIERSTMRINSSLSTFFSYAPPKSPSFQANSIYQLLDEVLEIAFASIVRKRIVVSKEYAAPDNKIILSRTGIKIALVSIIMHAIARMIPGEGQLKFKTKIINNKFVLRIEDNGSGIGGPDHKDTSNPHFSNITDRQGLATPFNLLRSNYFGIDVELHEGRGTNFIMVFKNTN